jgi:hypothetical protein
MVSRRSLLTAVTLLASFLVVPGLVRATEEPAKKAEAKTEAAVKQADFLFVQNARDIHYADGKLTLKGVSPDHHHVFRPSRADRGPHGHCPVRALLVKG